MPLSSGANERPVGTFVSVASVARTDGADSCKGLIDVWGEVDEHMCAGWEAAGKGKKTVKTHQLWPRIREAQMDTGPLSVLYKIMGI